MGNPTTTRCRALVPAGGQGGRLVTCRAWPVSQSGFCRLHDRASMTIVTGKQGATADRDGDGGPRG